MNNHFIRNRWLAGAWMVAVMVLSGSAAHAASAAAGATKYANTCAGCHGVAPGFATRPSVHKASAKAGAIPHYLPGDVDIAAFVPPSRPEIILPSPPGAADLTANSAKLLIASSITDIITITSFTVSCTGGGATKTAAGAPTPGVFHTAITVTGLTASTPYNCSGTATNSSGTSLASAYPVSIATAAATAPPAALQTPTVNISLLNSGQGGTAVQCPVQYSSSNPPRWFIRASAHLPRERPALAISGGPSRVAFRYMYMVNGYPPPGHSPGVWQSAPGVTFVPPTRSTYNFEVFAQAWHNEQPVSRSASSAVISCKVQ